MKHLKACVFLVFMASFITNAQNENKALWNTKQCAVSLTYDDGLNVHLDNVLTILDSLGLKATFYVPGNSASLNNRLNDWKALANKGHELGNHTLFHPCDGKPEGREWVNPDYDLDTYSIDKIVSEIKLANTLLHTIDGKTKRTFAYTCGDTAIRDSSFIELIKTDFVGARGVEAGFETSNLDLFDVKAFSVNGDTADHLISIVEQAKTSSSLAVFLFHGVGGEHNLNVDLDEHNKFVQYLKENEASIWVSPLVDVLEYIKKER
ncbi:polysaccharide deacetylase family protein [Thalassobellus sediminis]|uniref:polysaccharide deacetylase family protein n=1 Tax=Thalassobellus sediminis TaxID=3367753 RepID=UPI00379087D4